MTAGGLLFVSTGSDKKLRAYDRETGKEVWSRDLPATSEGMPATYEVNGRQYIVVPVAAGNGQFAARFGGPPPAPPPRRSGAHRARAAGGRTPGWRGRWRTWRRSRRRGSAARPVHGVCAAAEVEAGLQTRLHVEADLQVRLQEIE